MRTLLAAYWSANSFVNAASPARKTPEVGNIGLGSKTHAVEMLRMTPLFCLTITGATRRVGRITFSR